MMLHLLADSVLSQSVIDRIAPGDDVVLQAPLHWAAFAGHQDNVKLQALLECRCNIYLLDDQRRMSGIGESQLLPGVQAINYAKLVELTVENSVIHTWS